MTDLISQLLGQTGAGAGSGGMFAGATTKFRLSSPSGYNLPKPKFLYYVNFVTQNLAPNTLKSLGFFVKKMDRIQMTYDLTELNQYNKKRVVQGKANYGNLSFSFYDTTDGTAVKLLEAYNRFYYGDFQSKNNASWNSDTVGANFEFAPVWGLNAAMSGNSGYFFDRIEVYEMYDQVYSQINFINPKFSSIDMQATDVATAEGQEISVQTKYEGIVFQAIAQPVTQALAAMWGLPYHNDILSGLLGGLNIPGFDISSGVGLPGQSLLSSAANAIGNKLGITNTTAFNSVNSILNGVLPSAVANNTAAQTINGYFGSTVGGGQPTMQFLSPLSSLSNILPGVQNQVSAGQSVRNISSGSFNIFGALNPIANF